MHYLKQKKPICHKSGSLLSSTERINLTNKDSNKYSIALSISGLAHPSFFFFFNTFLDLLKYLHLSDWLDVLQTEFSKTTKEPHVLK